LHHSMPGKVRSPAYLVRPVPFETPSTRRNGLPMTV
jgi:hypothetical protein